MLKVIVVALVVAAVAADLDAGWVNFKNKYSRQYPQEMDQIRKSIWKKNMEYIEQHNELYDQGVYSYCLGENEFTDMTNAEFVATFNGFRPETSDETAKYYERTYKPLPDTVDWRTKGYVTPIKRQYACGSCWAFSATGSMEGQHFKKSGKLVSLSEQNLVDCSKNGNHGCEGGLMTLAFRYVIKNHGIDTEMSYPYTAKDGHCHFKANDIGATFSEFKNIKKGSEGDLKEAVSEVGPISVAIDASHPSFQHYRSGVYNEPKCDSTTLDHGVLAIGYGIDGITPYWLVKNSWGTSWGNKGFIKMSRNRDNQCGIATAASYPLV